MEPNALLDALLDEAGMSHSGLAKRINIAAATHGLRLRYDHTSVGRWLRGQRPRDPVPDLVCDILGTRLSRQLTPEGVGFGPVVTCIPAAASVSDFVERASTMWRADRQQRLGVEKMAVSRGTGAIAPIWDWETPGEDIDVSRLGEQRVDADEIEMLRAARARYEMMYRQVGGIVTGARVIEFLYTQALPILRGSFGHRLGREIYQAAGGIVALAGICAYDSDAQGLAQRYFHQALRLAKASGDRGFGAYVIALLANQALFLADLRQAVALAEAGLRTGGAYVTPALAADLHAMAAKAYARIGHQSETHSRIAEAEGAAERICRAEEPPETEYVHVGLIEAHVAEALDSLGDFTAARRTPTRLCDVAHTHEVECIAWPPWQSLGSTVRTSSTRQAWP